jgi:ABC-type polysaccharide/polyol phosphate transport system ATPase subunit
MMNAIDVNGVSKKYRLYHDYAPTLKEKILFRNRSSYEDLWVLKDIDLQIEPGQTVGLIGQNGSGKSTLLKLMSQIIYPDKGEIKMNGRVSSLLELGAGFHPDFTGLENIYMNAAIFGMARKEIDRRLDAILEFAELGDFINSAVRTYSSGMYMRLAFSVAINVNADILLIDEILSVGDQNFQLKCFDRIREIKGAGKTVVIVSHDLPSIERLCNRVVWLNNGVIAQQGKAIDVIDQYTDFNTQERFEVAISKAAMQEEQERLRWGSKELEFVGLKILDSVTQKEISIIDYGQSIEICFEFKCNKPVEKPLFGIAIYSIEGVYCYGTNTMIDRIETNSVSSDVTVRFIIDELLLTQGKYWIDIAAASIDFDYDYIRKVKEFEIISPISDLGIYRPKHKWAIDTL